MRTAVAVVFAFALAAVLPAAGKAVAPTVVSCGQTITTSIVVANDLVDCPVNGLEAGADGITIDLNGHTIDGAPASGIGVLVAAHNGVTVKNGTLKEFGAGAYVFSVSEEIVFTGLRVQDGGAGIVIGNCSGCRIEASVIARTGSTGISISGGPATTVSGVTVVGNTGNGVVFTGFAPGSTLTKSAVTGNGLDGVRVDNGADLVTVSGNLVAANGRVGIDLYQGSLVTITKNDVTGNGRAGVVNANDGILVEDSDNVGIASNVVRGNEYNGVEVDVGSTNVALQKNTVIGNGGDGIDLIDGTGLSAVQNTTNANGRSGVEILTAGATITKSTATANGDFGLDGFAGNTDGGGHKVSQNGSVPTQCDVIACGDPPPIAPVASALCGSTITTSLKLTADITCPAAGLTVDAPGVTVDLNRHTIDGPTGSNQGIRILKPGVIVKNGFIRDFATGILDATTATGVVLTGLTLYDQSGIGIDLDGGQSVVTKSLVADAGGTGISVPVNGEDTQITRTAVVDAGVVGIDLLGPAGVTVARNTVVSSGEAGVRLEEAGGLYGTISTSISGNLFAASGQPAIRVSGVDSNGNTITKNTVVGSGFSFTAFLDDGILVEEGNQNVVTANTVLGAHNDGIEADLSADQTTIAKNTVAGSGDDGINALVTTGSTLTANQTTGNAGSGIESLATSITIRKNTADANAVMGIAATAGTTDGGGNKASRNGSFPGQCQFVVCS